VPDKPIVLDHFLFGPLKVRPFHEASYWTGAREWTCDDRPELGAMPDGFFRETREQIGAKLAELEPVP
jgi:hypothetical protein